MRLENYITHKEYLDTIKLAYKVKKIYGINAYFLFKKICMVAACKAGTIDNRTGLRYIEYDDFLSVCSRDISYSLKIDELFNINMLYNEKRTLFGTPVEYIYDFNVLELDEILTKPTSIKPKKPLEAWG